MKLKLGIAVALFCCGLFVFSQNLTDSLTNLLTDNQDTTQIQIMNELSWQLCCTDNKQAIIYARKSIRLARKLNYQKGLATAYNYLGVVYQNNGLYDSSVYYLENALEIFNNYRLENSAAGCLNNIGVTHLYQSNWDHALDFFYRALAVKQRLNDVPGLVSVYNNIGIVYANLQNPEKALAYYLKSIEASDQYTEEQSLANTLNNIGLIYQDKQEYDSAMYFFNRAFATCKSNENKKGIAATLSNMATLRFLQGKSDEATGYYQQALAIDKELDDVYAVVSLYLNLGAVYQSAKDFSLALDYYTKALAQAQYIGSKGQIVNALEGLSTTYELMGNYSQSLQMYKAFKLTQDTVFTEESEKYISDLREKYEAEQRERKISELNAAAMMQEYKLRSQRRWLMVSVFGMILVIGFSIVMLVQRNQKYRAYKELLRINIENFKIENQNQVLSVSEFETEISENPDLDTLDVDSIQEKYKSSGLELFQKDLIHQRILFAMEKRKLYLQPDLTIDKLAVEIKTNKTYISQVINEKENQNFSSFLNDFRIREAMRLLLDKDHKHLTIESIAKKVGFNSKSAFNGAFKKFTGITPSFFIKNAPGQTF